MFKPGDKVVCADAMHAEDELNQGSVYVVYDVSEEGRYVRVHYSNTWFAAYRFDSLPTTGEGVKHDQNKPDMALLSPIALVKIAQVRIKQLARWLCMDTTPQCSP